MTVPKKFLGKNVLAKVGVLLVLLVVGGFGFQWLTYERQPLPAALAALASDDQVIVTQAAWLTFSPTNPAPETGFIFYPGGRISYLGYSDFMQAVAAQGYLVVVPQMPFNIAAMRPEIASEIIAAHPEISQWVIGGHSVGGTMAAQYTKTHAQQISGLVIWASYPADNADLSNSVVPTILVYVSLDPAANDEQILSRRHLLPQEARFVRIEGGDHHQFGSYEIRPEDHLAAISRADQRQQVLQATLNLLQLVSNPSSQP